MKPLVHSPPGRILALVLSLALVWLGCDVSPPLAPADGVPEYQRGGLVRVPGGFVNGAGGNLLVERLELSIDTPMGTHEVRAIYNAFSGAWLWSFQIRYDGAVFIDPTGAAYAVSGLADGEPIPGSVWVKGDADTIETRGGLAHHFDAAGRLDHVAWRSASYPRLEYTWSAAQLDVASCTQAAACQPFLAVALDASGRPLSLAETRSGRVVQLAWDALGRLETARSPQDVAEGRPGSRYEYATASTLLTALTNSEGERIEYTYQAGRRIRKVTQAGEERPTHRFSFLSAGGLGLYPTIYVDPLGVTTRLLFDDLRRLHRVKRVDTAEIVQQQWSGRRVARHELPGGVVTELGWEGDELVTLRRPSGNLVTFSYEPGALNPGDVFAAPVRSIEDSLGLILEQGYDALGRPVTRRNGEGEETAITYLSGTTVATVTEPDGVVHAFPRYGVHGHWLEREGAAPDERLLDPVGNPLVAASLARGGGILTRTWDADRRLASLEVAASEDGRVTARDGISIARRSDGRLLAVARPGGGDHEFVYDAIGRLVERRERVDGAWQATSFEYDAAGRMLSRTRPNGMREEWAYDGYGRLLRHRALRDGVLEGEALLTWVDGRLASRFDSLRGTAEIYGYDDAGHHSTTWFGNGETLDLEWDPRSRLVRETYSLPGLGEIRRVDYAYDLADRHVGIVLDDGEQLLHHVYADGRLVSTHYGNGLVRDFAYDPVSGLLVGATTVDALGQTLETTTVARTLEVAPPRSQVATATDTPLASTAEDYWIGPGTSPADPDQRMGKRVFGWRDGRGDSLAFAYDLLGNPADDADGDTFTTNAERNRLLAATLVRDGVTLDYTWDEAGFATSRGGVPIEWTATGRLTSHGSIAIEWDMRGRPISWSANGLARDLTLFGGRIDSDPETGELGSLDLGEVMVSFGAGRRYRHPDFRGNVRFVSDESGAVVSHYAYSPYGLDAIYGEDGGVAFAGGRRLGDLVWLGERIYDPAVGRFLSPDPVFHLVNAYAYVMGNPVWFSDPDGTEGGTTGGDVAVGAIGLAFATGGLLTLGPEASVAAVFFGVGGFYVALIFFAIAAGAYLSERSSGDGDGAGALQGGAFAGTSPSTVAFAAPAPVGCAPTRLGEIPDLGWLLYWLLPLQLAAAVALLRRRAAAGRRRLAP